jgi:lipoprotein-anchoring transpeptidase ErfK/SrfK
MSSTAPLRTRLAAMVAAVLLTACGTTAAPPVAAGGPPAAPDTTAAPTVPVPTTPPHLIARVTGPTPVFAAPGDAAPEHTLPATTPFDSPTVLAVLTEGTDGEEGWLQVALPVRPNGSSGWVRAGDVELRPVDVAVEVDLEARELTVRDLTVPAGEGDVVLRTATAIGDADHPTPTGTFFVTDKLDTGDPGGPYGPYALGLSAYSEVLTEFAGGEGQVGIHGTDAPASVGQAASKGCLRVDNGVVEQLAGLLPLGTPVTIF